MIEYKPAIGFDTETHPFRMGLMVPPMVCMATCINDGETYSNFVSAILDKDLDKNIEAIVEDNGFQKVAHNCAFDLAVLGIKRPDLLPAIFAGLEKGIFECTIIREKLLHLATHGDLEFYTLPDGVTIKLDYSLAGLVRRYLGIERKGEKTESDSWRKNYNVLETMPVASWPPDAVQYVADDAEQCLRIREIQEAARVKVFEKTGHDPFVTLEFQVACDFALQLMHAYGFRVDKEAKAKIEAELKEALRPEKMQRLMNAGILIPGQGPAPYANGASTKCTACNGTGSDGSCTECRGLGVVPKMKAAVPEKVSKTNLITYIRLWAKENNVTLTMTDPTDRNPEGQISTAIEFFEEHRGKNPLFEEYYNRAKLQKLVTTEMPRMNIPGTTETADIVHPCFDVLKKTGRTSSYGTDLYPSFNCQNVDPRVRNCFIPRDGNVMFSIDYSGMELGTLAQKVYNLFGHSVHRDKINAGIDNHTFLGSQLAYALDTQFRAACDHENVSSPEDVYDTFVKCKSHADEGVRKLFKHYRTFAKPTGLGYPGGLGPATFCGFAKASYGVDVDEATAIQLRNIWHQTYPEMKQYFAWVNDNCNDPANDGKYAYTTPFGMYRAGADYCACANGAALQAFSAEGAKLSVFNVLRACNDASACSILFSKMKPLAFIHDEILGEVPEAEAHELCMEASEIMVESFRVVTPDVAVKAQPVLMRRWNKNAEPVFKQGRLVPWQPSK